MNDGEVPTQPEPSIPPGETAVTPTTVEKTPRAPAASLEPSELAEFSKQPTRIQQLIAAALDLTKLNLTYTYGSAEPAAGGMDCSGTIYYLLRSQGVKDVPRDSSSQYIWARQSGQFFAVVSTQADSFEFKDLQPGDLMFWSGTYNTGRSVPISHVMLYLGHEKGSGKSVMFGSSDGRSYNGVQRWGVSVFDFKMPKADPAKPEKRVDFVGYARIPGLRESPALAALSTNAPARAPVVAAIPPPPREPAPAPASESVPPIPAHRAAPRDTLREPPRGSPERKAIMDALRTGNFSQAAGSVVFQVHTLKVRDGWAWTEITPLNSQGKPVAGRKGALLQFEEGQWKSLNLDKLPEDPGNPSSGKKTSSTLVKTLLEAYPNLPPDILPTPR